MRSRKLRVTVGLLLATVGLSRAEDLCFNGAFDHSDGPLAGWTYDYQWSGNSHYLGNHKKVSAVAREGSKSHVVKIGPSGDAGAKIESKPIPFEQGYRYTCTADVKGSFRIYFAGYKWEPGIRPHADPPLGKLRKIYKSKVNTTEGDSWRKVKFEVPGVQLSNLALAHLKHVRFLTVYFWTIGGGCIDNVKVMRTKYTPASPQ